MTPHNVESQRVELFDLNELRRCPNPALTAAAETEMRGARSRSYLSGDGLKATHSREWPGDADRATQQCRR